MEKDSKEWVDRLPAEAKTRLDAALEGAKQALRSRRRRTASAAPWTSSTQAYSAAGASLYQSAQGAGGRRAGRRAAPRPADARRRGTRQEDVVEADYEIVDDKK